MSVMSVAQTWLGLAIGSLLSIIEKDLILKINYIG